MKNAVALLVLDGWGIGEKNYSNPVHIAKPKNIFAIKSRYFAGSLQSSGIAVGLPWGEEGNSEVGHLTLGAGRIIYQHFPRITLTIQSGEFFKNPVFEKAFTHANENNSATHLIGLATEGNVHASLEHLRALIRFASERGVKELYLHLMSDGKDSAPKSALQLIEKIKGFIKEFGVGTIASISGRFYGLDRDEHWERTEKVYRMLTEGAPAAENIEEHIRGYYSRGLGDEFIEPMAIGPTPRSIRDNDSVIFFDFREDSIRQLASPFAMSGFAKFRIRAPKNLFVATMTEYSNKLNAPAAFPNEPILDPLGKILSDNNKLQLRIAETEKYAHVTFFFNAYREAPFENEYRVLIPSKNVARHDASPDMMVQEVATRAVESIEEGGFDFILINFANPDTIAHTGNYDAALQAIAAVDAEVERIARSCLATDTALIITSDHGNIEKMIDPFTGYPQTKHDPNLVPFYLVGKKFERPKNDSEIDWTERDAIGIIADVAPTILELMEIPKPATMTGQSLLRRLR